MNQNLPIINAEFVMNPIPLIFNEHLISMTVLGGKEALPHQDECRRNPYQQGLVKLPNKDD